MVLTRQQLLQDLYQAYFSAKKHKSKRSYVRKWEKNLKANMDELCDDLYNRTYYSLPSKCFIVNYPKKREIFAAVFRDRIVHHLYFNYTHKLYERTFIEDTYSCIKGRGTDYGINRIRDFCRKESRNWQRQCYVLHLDIRGYFMHIVRNRLLQTATASLEKMTTHKISKHSPQTWGDVLDMDFVKWLTSVIILLNPKRNCIIVGSLDDWAGLDSAKSMLNLEDGIGLPIGNLTSQLFSNVYLNLLDQFMKRVLKCKYYGRYVDDAAVISTDKEWLLSLVPRIRDFLFQELGLELHMGKLDVSKVHNGVEFLGMYIKPYRNYISNHSVERMILKINQFDYTKPWKVVRSVNSYLGIFRRAKAFNLCRKLLFKKEIMSICVFNQDMTKAVDRKQFYNLKKPVRDYLSSAPASGRYGSHIGL